MLDERTHEVWIGKPIWPSDADLQTMIVKPAAGAAIMYDSVVDKDSCAVERVLLGPSDIAPVDHVKCAYQQRASKCSARYEIHAFDDV